MKKLFAVLSILISRLSFAAAKPKSIEGEVFDGGKSFFYEVVPFVKN